jgi:hypothetical protein
MLSLFYKAKFSIQIREEYMLKDDSHPNIQALWTIRFLRVSLCFL